MLKNATYFDSNEIYLHSILSIALVYVCCTAIDLIRQYLLEKPFFGIIEKLKHKEEESGSVQ